MTESPITVDVTRLTVSCIPEALHPHDHHTWAVQVEYAGHGRWAIRHHGMCLSQAGKWVYESMPSGRTDEWLDAHRFDRETAKRLAVEAAPRVRINGLLPADVLTRHAERS